LHSDETIFSSSDGDKGIEFKQIRQVLVEQGRLRLALVIMLYELKYTESGAAQNESIHEAFRLCESLERQSQLPATFRSVVLRTKVTDILTNLDPERAAKIREQCSGQLAGLVHPPYNTWEDFYPAGALDDQKSAVLRSAQSSSGKFDQLLSILDRAKLQGDLNKTNLLYIATLDVAAHWYQKSARSFSEHSALQRLLTVVEDYLNFHEDNGFAFCRAAALADYLIILCYRVHDYGAVLGEVEKFERECPDFAVPNLLEPLYRLAATAAAKLGLQTDEEEYSRKWDEVLQDCSFDNGNNGGRTYKLTEEAVFDPVFVYRAMWSIGDDLTKRGERALELMLRWAKCCRQL